MIYRCERKKNAPFCHFFKNRQIKKKLLRLNEGFAIIKLNGSFELAPITGLSDCIVDIVESGRTLRENGLEDVTTIHDLSARLVANPASLKTKYDEISKVVEGFRALLKEK